MFLKLCVLPMLLKVLDRSQKPFVCSVLFALIWLTNAAIFDLAFGTPWQDVLLIMGLNWLMSLGFFYALAMFADTGLYWAALVVGLLVMLAFGNSYPEHPSAAPAGAATPTIALPTAVPTVNF